MTRGQQAIPISKGNNTLKTTTSRVACIPLKFTAQPTQFFLLPLDFGDWRVLVNPSDKAAPAAKFRDWEKGLLHRPSGFTARQMLLCGRAEPGLLTLQENSCVCSFKVTSPIFKWSPPHLIFSVIKEGVWSQRSRTMWLRARFCPVANIGCT